MMATKQDTKNNRSVVRFPVERARPSTAPQPPYRPGDHVVHTPSGTRGIVVHAGLDGATIQCRGARLVTGWRNVEGLDPEPAA